LPLPGLARDNALSDRMVMRSLDVPSWRVALALVIGVSGGGLVAPDGHAQSRLVEGIARVLDGDTIEVLRPAAAPLTVRLEGIDAPEGGQRCQRRPAGEWDCGQAATYALRLLAEGRPVACDDLGLDRYGRTLGLCRVDGRDINAEMVRAGLAWAFVRYSAHYVPQEAEARQGGRGVWQAPTMPPWEWREQRRRDAALPASALAVASPAGPSGCDIKGAVTRNGRIYHTTESPWYDRVRMSLGFGRRWFCSEAEALAAGWRPVARN
jgi:endonuclease YncB( thermonuclease family)